MDLAMNGLAILVSTILLAPLTAFFVDASREARIKPTKAALFSAIARQFDQLAQRHLHFMAMLTLQSQVLSNGLQIQAIGDAFESFGRASERIVAKTERRPPELQPDVRPPLAVAAVKQSESIRKSALDHAEAIFRDIEQIDNSLLFCIPIFDPDSITKLSGLREHVVSFRAAMLDFRSVLHGNPDPAVAIRAKLAVLSFEAIDRSLKSLAADVGEPYPTANLGGDVTQMASVGVGRPMELISDIVRIIEFVREHDQTDPA